MKSEDWIISLEEAFDAVIENQGYKVAVWILRKFGVNSIYELDSADFSGAFSELDAAKYS